MELGERVSNFCEAYHTTGLVQPVNAISSLVFVVFAIGLFWFITSRQKFIESNRAYSNFYALAVALIGLSSFIAHGTETHLGGQLDISSMFLLVTFMILLAISRIRTIKPGLLFTVLIVLNIPLFFIAGLSDAVTYNLFAVLVILLIWLELLLQLAESRLKQPYFWFALLSLVAAYVVWQLDARGIWCDPTSLWQGHAFWHLLTALAALLFYFHLIERTYRLASVPKTA